MIALILFIVFGIVFSFFATLNTAPVTLHLASYTLEKIPLYIVVLAAFGLGIIFTALFYFVRSLSGLMLLNKKEHEISGLKKEVTDLSKTIHQLEIENTKLKVKNGEESEDENSL